MSLLSKVGAFNLSGDVPGSTMVVTGVGFQPKAIIFWWGGTTSAADFSLGATIARGIGVATSTTSRWTVGTQSVTAQPSSDNDRIHREDVCIATITTVGGVDGLIDVQSIDADGFTLVVDDSSAFTRRIHYLALGGTDLTNVTTGRFDEPAATGTQDITGVGFQPDFVLFGSIGLATDPNTVTTNSILMVGAAASSSEEAVLYNVSATGATTMDTKAYSVAGECIALSVAGATNARAELDSFLTDGFRLNWLERGSDRVIFYLALKGGQYHVGDFNTSISNGATIAETGLGFSPKGTMLFSHGRAQDTQDVLTDSDQWNVGAFTSTTERGVQGVLDEDNVADSDTEFYVEHDQALAQWTTAPAVVGLVDVQSIDSDGFTLVMDSAADPAAFVWYAAFGDAPTGTLVTPATIAVVATLPTPAVLAASTVTPAAIAVVAALPTPLIAAAATVTPAAIAVVTTLPTPIISVAPVVTPAVIAVVTTLPTPSVLAASTVTPAVIPLVVTLPTPLAGAPTVVLPAAVAVTAGLPTPSILAASKVTPAVIPLAALLPTPTATDSASAVATPAVIAASVGLPTPIATTDAVVTPAGIALVVTIPTPSVTTPGLVTPAGISLIVTVPTPLATVGAITFWTPDPVFFVPVGPGDEPPWN